ncbi:MAG: cell division protein FtsW [Candidatus Schekmanbacteria bacterium RIFCSPHIGHO2_02_FULL_38_11]|uniref:Probable peptidoglycan glycosyltransferase FtsW n=1 Tax=Candidatus Schekmanbacteria bacterium RIFCSPLOWO2_12_FULL_38_15 TaxID=1817883 RepID=A0A1F7SGX6_9BACT|nr:MAG: cell division protein FtsW [Candidatus Schekmanbacteria bacterium GWA2_38_9]OGL49699.1 MAG: cell division protein FtsW [Candidatus Schekmanbacteria bacterium RIFCSPLOWO2_02_FULL_38_14]OGL51050.1 MAG: cell division protein FtsW [Candidatus Schekmanbacteria bacterium RIFCSPHIGHO2_02_FULL_38_11]OGL53053.1 MAG: cell division protein FtsW [Candidatus Schekmanbacteria bacterium RIFCSPLOWO2_12_FULL_38_15]
MPRKYAYDHLLLFITLVLTGIGAIMVYSASAIIALEGKNDSYYFLKKQLVFLFMGFVLMAIVMHFDYTRLRNLAVPFLFLSFIMLIAVLIPGLGLEKNGARRWLNIFGFVFQPSELAKFSLVLYTAYSISKRKEKIHDFFNGTLPLLIMLGIFCMLIMLQPDLGTVIVMASTTFLLLFAGGAKLRHLIYLVLASLPFLYFSILNVSYRRRRILAFLDPWSDQLDTGYQIVQSFLAFGSGGIWGTGIGEGKGKLFYLPWPHTDFIFSIIGEELGFIGVSAVIFLFFTLIWRGIRISMNSRDLFGTFLSLGITLLLGLQSAINIGVTLGLFPTKGLPLPFISYGGSSVVLSLFSVGVLLSISDHA